MESHTQQEIMDIVMHMEVEAVMVTGMATEINMAMVMVTAMDMAMVMGEVSKI